MHSHNTLIRDVLHTYILCHLTFLDSKSIALKKSCDRLVEKSDSENKLIQNTVRLSLNFYAFEKTEKKEKTCVLQ
jgi:hypothetical protein